MTSGPLAAGEFPADRHEKKLSGNAHLGRAGAKDGSAGMDAGIHHLVEVFRKMRQADPLRS